MSEQTPESVWITRGMGLRLRAAREAKGFSQSQLAQMTGSSLAQIAHYERGEHAMAMERLFDLARILEIPAADLFDA